VKVAYNTAPGSERNAVLSVPEHEPNATVEDRCPIREAVEARVRKCLPFFFNRTFGLCITAPSAGGGIARKELFQEKLTELTANGSIAAPANASKDGLIKHIDDYVIQQCPSRRPGTDGAAGSGRLMIFDPSWPRSNPSFKPNRPHWPA